MYRSEPTSGSAFAGNTLQRSVSDETDTDELQATAGTFADAAPRLWDAYSNLGKACSEAAPLDDETRRPEEGLTDDRLHHVAVLSIPTLGFPQAMAARSWISDLTE